MKIKCTIVDDEEIARKLLTDYVGKIPELELVATCSNPLEAMQFLREGKTDLLFLDIQMPNINGIDFLKTLHPRPQVILTTAYSEYALQGYELNVLDYLLKPIEFMRFYQAANKAMDFFNNTHTPRSISENIQLREKENFLFIKTENKIVKVEYNNIEYLISKGAYVQIIIKTGKNILTLQSMNRMEEILPEDQFFRVHRSHIVNINHIHSIEGNLLQLSNDEKIKISKSKRDLFIQKIDRNKLL